MVFFQERTTCTFTRFGNNVFGILKTERTENMTRFKQIVSSRRQNLVLLREHNALFTFVMFIYDTVNSYASECCTNMSEKLKLLKCK